MPTYEYACGACKERFELFQSITAKTVQPCPKCGKQARRLISGGAGLIFKGSGFYITDYRSSDYKSQASADKPAGAPPAGGKKDAGASPAASSSTSTSASSTASGNASASTSSTSTRKGKPKS